MLDCVTPVIYRVRQKINKKKSTSHVKVMYSFFIFHSKRTQEPPSPLQIKNFIIYCGVFLRLYH